MMKLQQICQSWYSNRFVNHCRVEIQVNMGPWSIATTQMSSFSIQRKKQRILVIFHNKSDENDLNTNNYSWRSHNI